MTGVLGQSRDLADEPDWRRGQGDGRTPPGGGVGGQETGEPQGTTWGSRPEGLGMQRNHKGESARLEALTHPTRPRRAAARGPTRHGRKYLRGMWRWDGQAARLDTRKPRTEVAPGTTTPTRLWGCLAYTSQNPLQQLRAKALVATGPARPTTPSNPCGPLGSASRFPSALPGVLSAPAQRHGIAAEPCAKWLHPVAPAFSVFCCCFFFRGIILGFLMD